MALRIEIDLGEDGQWVARVPELGGLVGRGTSRTEALRAVQVEALRVLAGQLERGERSPFGAFTVVPYEGEGVLALRSRAAETLRELQLAAVDAGLDQLSEEEIEAEIQAARRERDDATKRGPKPPVVKSG